MLFIAFFAALCAGQEPTVTEILHKAIAAHGGKEALSKARADKVRLKGTMTLVDKPVPFLAETSVVLPDRLRTVLRMNPGPQETVMTQLVMGDKLAMYINGQPQVVTDGLAATLRETLLMNRAMRLVSLLGDKTMTPVAAGEGIVNGRPARIIRVAPPGRREIKLWFDNETNLLVKTEHPVGLAANPIVQEEYYGDFRLMGAFRRPAKVVTLRGGKKIIEAEIVEVRYPDSIPESEFLKP